MSFTTLDLIAASTNALNGALLARRPDHYKNFTVVGIMLMALLMGLGGGITRDILVNQVPSALTNPAYITLCVIVGAIGYHLAFAKGQLFREGLFQFMTSFSLPLYAIVGAQKGVDRRTAGGSASSLLAVVGPTAGRWYVDVSSGVPPKQFIRGEWFVTIALLTGIVWVLCDTAGLDTWAERRDRLRDRLHPPRPRPLPRMGGTTRQRTDGRVRARRRPPAPRPQAQGQVEARDGTTSVSRRTRSRRERRHTRGRGAHQACCAPSAGRSRLTSDARGMRNSPADARRDTRWVIRDGRRVGMGVSR